MEKFIFKEISVEDFVKQVLNAKEESIAELGCYVIVNDCFFNIDECQLETRAIKIHNCSFDISFSIGMKEIGMIYQMENRTEFFDVD